MLNNIKKFKIYQEPCKHIIISHPIPMLDYDHLYEQWNNLNHTTWKSFLSKYQIDIIFKNKLEASAHRGKKELIGYWFFKQRSDRRSISINLLNKKIDYLPNVLLILDSQQSFKTINKNYLLPDMLTCIIYFNNKQQDIIKESLSL